MQRDYAYAPPTGAPNHYYTKHGHDAATADRRRYGGYTDEQPSHRHQHQHESSWPPESGGHSPLAELFASARPPRDSARPRSVSNPHRASRTPSSAPPPPPPPRLQTDRIRYIGAAGVAAVNGSHVPRPPLYFSRRAIRIAWCAARHAFRHFAYTLVLALVAIAAVADLSYECARTDGQQQR
ncbi:hypothetical protein THASP1DRAFT_25425 [Thamnocephalis sphaerospora]|uniref:Uncharacterized protein n=1 Tax=Thamnocephalis sphaerospora TaxID=78915 RepID=A0A4P9XKD3_9FUNG|nr:hypothetical protein THASP1DRAFT_25425 [Thamnocephalis sphaerospora]|eukprot:RKP06212.1 hypothetical protein THASP1DRAFT_25425 [Thamnocephalis sphaerospora]